MSDNNKHIIFVVLREPLAIFILHFNKSAWLVFLL